MNISLGIVFNTRAVCLRRMGIGLTNLIGMIGAPLLFLLFLLFLLLLFHPISFEPNGHAACSLERPRGSFEINFFEKVGRKFGVMKNLRYICSPN